MSRHISVGYHTGLKPYSNTTFIPRFDSALTPGSPEIKNAPFISPRSSFTTAQIIAPTEDDQLIRNCFSSDKNLPDGKLSQQVVLLADLKILQQEIVEQCNDDS